MALPVRTSSRPRAPVFAQHRGVESALDAKLRLIKPSARTVVSALKIEEQPPGPILDFTSPPGDWAGLSNGFTFFVRIEEWHIDDAQLVPLSPSSCAVASDTDSPCKRRCAGARER